MITNIIGGDTLTDIFNHAQLHEMSFLCNISPPAAWKTQQRGKGTLRHIDVFSHWGSTDKHHQQREILRFTIMNCKIHIKIYIAN